jgi:hypothetical protein
VQYSPQLAQWFHRQSRTTMQVRLTLLLPPRALLYQKKIN